MINSRIKSRIDSISKWTSANPKLLNGEIAVVVFEDGSTKIKIGDGQKPFVELPYAYGETTTSADVSSIINAYEYTRAYVDGKSADISVEYVDYDVYRNMVSSGTLPEGVFYAVSSDVKHMYGERVAEVGDPVDDSDAVNKKYVDQEISKIDVSEQIAPIQRELSGKILVAGYGQEFQPGNLSIVNVSMAQYGELAKSGGLSAEVFYNISSDGFLDGFGQPVQNVGEPVLSDDAATKGYVDSEIQKIDITDQISDFYKKNETSSAAEISSAVSARTTSAEVSAIIEKFDKSRIIINGVKSDLSIRNMSDVEYYSLTPAERAISNMLYVVSSENENFFGERLQNVGEPQISSDAATKNYVDTEIAKIDVSEQLTGYQLKGDYLSATADHTTSAQVSAIVEGYTSKMVTIRKWSD